jgi:hypothetical protein
MARRATPTEGNRHHLRPCCSRNTLGNFVPRKSLPLGLNGRDQRGSRDAR